MKTARSITNRRGWRKLVNRTREKTMARFPISKIELRPGQISRGHDVVVSADGASYRPGDSPQSASIRLGLFPLDLNDLLSGFLLHASQLKHDFAVIGASKLRRVRVFLP